MAPPSPAPFADANDIDHFWPPEPRSANEPNRPSSGSAGQDNGLGTSNGNGASTSSSGASLAVEAARDPFKNARNAGATATSPAGGSGSANRGAYPPSMTSFPSSGANNAGGSGSKAFASQLAAFPGQAQMREIGQPVSAMRTSDGTTADPADAQQEGTNGQSHGEMERTDDWTQDRSRVEMGRDASSGHNHQHPHHHHHQQHHHQHSQPLGSPSANAAPSSASGSGYRGGPDMGPAPGTPGASDADTSMMSQHGLGDGMPRKRKTFKYLQDEPVGDTSVSSDVSYKRKKVQKACRPCKRSHMPCQEQRPCPRCIKRGIPELCVDAEPVTRGSRKTAQAANRAGSSSRSSSTSARVNNARPLVPEGQTSTDIGQEGLEAIASAAKEEAAADAAAAASVAEAIDASLSHTYIKVSLNDLEPSQVETLERALTSHDSDYLDIFGGHPLSLLADAGLPAAADDDQDAPFSHTRSYARLAKWAQSTLSETVSSSLDVVTGAARGHFLEAAARIHNDIGGLDDDFNAAINNMVESDMLDSMPLPTFVARRSGEIVAVNHAGTQEIGIDRKRLLDAKLNLLQLTPDRNVIELAKLLTNSQTLHLGESTSSKIPLDIGHFSQQAIAATTKTDEDEGGNDLAYAASTAAAALGGQTPKMPYVVNLKSKPWRADGMTLLVVCTLTPIGNV